MAGVGAKDDIFFTRTMAELLEKQGRFEDALAVYKILKDSSPDDTSLDESIKRLKSGGSKAYKGGG